MYGSDRFIYSGKMLNIQFARVTKASIVLRERLRNGTWDYSINRIKIKKETINLLSNKKSLKNKRRMNHGKCK